MLVITSLLLSVTSLILLEKVHPTSGIVGGYSDSTIAVPWVVSLSLINESWLMCSGVLISPDWVLTAALCVVYIKPGDIIVRLGSDYSSNGGLISPVDKVVVNDDFSAMTKNYNYALLKLRARFDRSQRIASVPLRNPDERVFIGQECIISGYGLTTTDGTEKQEGRLHSAVLSIMNRDACSNSLFPFIITNSMLCAGGESDGCTGDAGGPLVCGGKLAGIISWGKGCEQYNSIGIYTDFISVWQWLKSYGVIP